MPIRYLSIILYLTYFWKKLPQVVSLIHIYGAYRDGHRDLLLPIATQLVYTIFYFFKLWFQIQKKVKRDVIISRHFPLLLLCIIFYYQGNISPYLSTNTGASRLCLFSSASLNIHSAASRGSISALLPPISVLIHPGCTARTLIFLSLR